MRKEYDILLYGATGVTGRQAAEYLGRHAPEGMNWAVAGRNRRRLEAVAEKAAGRGPRPRVIVAEAADERALHAAVSQARVVASTAGPFSLTGENLVAACAEQGTDYVDITGETAFVRRMIDSYGGAARTSGAKIIPFCGFDAVPSDIGALLAVRHVREVLQCRPKAVRGYFSIRGGLNGGTFSTMLNMFESGAWKTMKNPGLLIDDGGGDLEPAGEEYRIRYDRGIRSWTAPFMMGVINTPVVNRSAALHETWGEGYGDSFSYSEYHRLGGRWNPLPALAVTVSLRAVDRLGQYSLMRRAMKFLGPGPGESPSEESMDEGFFNLDVIAETEKGPRATVRISGKGDPGNRATVKFLCESALCLAMEREDLPGGADRCGFLTPATGLGAVLANRLKGAGVSIRTGTNDLGKGIAA